MATTNPNNIIIGFDPNSFFYETIQDDMKPTDDTCDLYKPNGKYDVVWDTSCNSSHLVDNSLNCLQVELCKNKDYATSIANVMNTHYETGEKLDNSKTIYHQELRRTINLSVAILLMGGFMYYVGKSGVGTQIEAPVAPSPGV
jgi:hypothetical protein